MHPTRTYVLFNTALCISVFLHAATYVPFLTGIGLTLADIAYINAVFFAVIVVLELPTGVFADKISRSTALVLGALGYTAGNGLYAFAHTRTGALLAEIVLGTGLAFLSGVQQAWITDSLIARGESQKLKSVFATASVVEGLIAVPISIIGSWWAVTYGTRSVWWLCALFGAFTTIIAWRYMRESGDAVTKLNEWEAVRQSLRALRRSRSLRWITGVSCIMALLLPGGHYWAPFFQSRGVGLGSLAYVWGAIYCAIALGGYLVRRGILRGDERKWLIIGAILAGGGLALMGWLPGVILPIAAAFLRDMGRGAFRPLVDTYTQQRVESSYRATYGSLQSLIARSANGFVLILVTWFMIGKSDMKSVTWVWTACGATLIVLSVILHARRPKTGA